MLWTLSIPSQAEDKTASARLEASALSAEFQSMVEVLESKRGSSWEAIQDLYIERLDIFKKFTERALQKDIPAIDAELIYYGAYLNIPEIFPRIGMPGLSNTYEDMFGQYFKKLWTGQTVKSVRDALSVLKARVSSHELGAHGEGPLSKTGELAIRLYEILAYTHIKHLQGSGVMP